MNAFHTLRREQWIPLPPGEVFASPAPVLLWLRQDLRLSDNPALAAALERRSPVIPVFLWAPEEEGAWPPGAASRWWLERSLASLRAELERRGSRLIIRRGPTAAALLRLAEESGASAVFWNRRYEPAAVARDRQAQAKLRLSGFIAESFNASLLFDPDTMRNGSGKPFRVFTPFWRACLRGPVAPGCRNAPRWMPSPEKWPPSLGLAELGLTPAADEEGGLREAWQPGEPGARRQLRRFLREALAEYPVNRGRPGIAGTSRLSPYLHFGEIGPGQVWRAILKLPNAGGAASQAYLRQLGWREFAYHLLYHHPQSPHRPLRPEFAAFPWRTHPARLQAWKLGQTGYPLVDAGMRELRRTGSMHNRVRMVAASFLVKHLMIDWRDGAAWFWDTLVDADLANNTLGWQWVAGCGADAAPYFRIFNPAIQAEKFDPGGDYIRRWVPDLARHPGMEPGETYPLPIVDHAEARGRALAALKSIQKRWPARGAPAPNAGARDLPPRTVLPGERREPRRIAPRP